MSYTSGEALILTRVQASSAFNSNNTSRGDWLILNSGKSDHYAILRPGPFEVEWITFSNYNATWTTVVEVWQQYDTPGTSNTNLQTQLASLFTVLQSTPRLGDTGGTVWDGTIRSGGEVEEMWIQGGGPLWLKWEVIFEWQEEINAR